MPEPALKPARVMPRPTVKPAKVMPRPTVRPVSVMPRPAVRPVRSAPHPTPGAVAFNRTSQTADNSASRDELRRRGTTVIADQVFEKIAGQAASEVATSRGRTGGVLGIGSDADASARPKVDVDLSADSADFDIAAGIAYPGSIRAAAQEIRDRVTRAVHELTGVPVHRVDIDVTFLTTPFGADGANAKHRKQVLR